mmetsp:Transcript_8075/g.14256  ORF Transcript_8075/g.14256 Transcript_8075/m.14256 type:complete len:213 (-) Transcript_8075:481-1119(-)
MKPSVWRSMASCTVRSSFRRLLVRGVDIPSSWSFMRASSQVLYRSSASRAWRCASMRSSRSRRTFARLSSIASAALRCISFFSSRPVGGLCSSSSRRVIASSSSSTSAVSASMSSSIRRRRSASANASSLPSSRRAYSLSPPRIAARWAATSSSFRRCFARSAFALPSIYSCRHFRSSSSCCLSSSVCTIRVSKPRRTILMATSLIPSLATS